MSPRAASATNSEFSFGSAPVPIDEKYRGEPMRRLGAALFVLAGSFILASPAPVSADEWPSRPVRIVNTFAPGGAADILARIVADHLSIAFKQQFYVETRSGAGGVIGVQTESGRATAGLRFFGSVERGPDGGAVVCHEGRPQVRDHSLQRRGAK